MRIVIQRVKKARVSVEGKTVSEIGKGMVILVGFKAQDDEKKVLKISEKLPKLRIFEDQSNKMNLSLLDVQGEILVVSEFTLYGNLEKGLRPSFTDAMPAQNAKRLYELFISKLKENQVKVKSGIFGAKMLVEIHNDGPVTFIAQDD